MTLQAQHRTQPPQRSHQLAVNRSGAHAASRSRTALQQLRAGFSLIEVMITLLIMGMIMMSMTMILDAARTSRDTIYNIQETQMAGPAIMDLIERDLRSLFTYNRDPSEVLRVQDRVLLGRDADSLDFVATATSLSPLLNNERFVRAPVNEIGYRLRENPDNDNFLEIYRREDFGVDDEPFDSGQYAFLHDRVRHFDIKVYLEDGPDAEEEQGWDPSEGDEEQTGLPARLEIRLEIELSPRIAREQLKVAPIDKRRVVFERIIRIPEILRNTTSEVRPVPQIPLLLPPNEAADPTAVGAAGSTGVAPIQ